MLFNVPVIILSLTLRLVSLWMLEKKKTQKTWMNPWILSRGNVHGYWRNPGNIEKSIENKQEN